MWLEAEGESGVLRPSHSVVKGVIVMLAVDLGPLG